MVSPERLNRSGLEAEVYLPTEPIATRPVVLVLSGSSGGLGHRDQAERLALDGYPAVALAYFGYGSLPPKLADIRLEYFQTAAREIRFHPILSDRPIVVMGRSRGGELALQLACSFDDFAGVIAVSPSSVRWGATGAAGPTWTLGGAPLPYMQSVPDLPPLELQAEEHEGKRYHYAIDSFRQQLALSPYVEQAAIPIEQCHGPVLLLSGRDDRLWPSAQFADRLEVRARDRGFRHALQNVQYEGVGHVLPLPGHPPVLRNWSQAIDMGMAYGGTEDGARAIAEDYWSRVLGFLADMG
ncbi:MAG: hypothetical protein OEZ06_32540 [Myxococcales bacterium]|nr:hypothetical protein [Myxococcales bacterium]